MKLTLLGVNGPCPTMESGCSGYLLESDGGTRILVDCGAGVLPRLRTILEPKDLSAVILSHLHFDHMSDMLVMEYCLQFNPKDGYLPVYAPDEPQAVRDLLDCPFYDLMELKDGAIGDIRVSCIPAIHPAPGYSLAFEADGAKFVFTGDTNENPGLELLADGADLLLADAALLERDWTEKSPHLSALRAGALAMRAGCRRLVLTHFFPQYDKSDILREARESFPEAEAGSAGEAYYL